LAAAAFPQEFTESNISNQPPTSSCVVPIGKLPKLYSLCRLTILLQQAVIQSLCSGLPTGVTTFMAVGDHLADES